MKMRIEEERKTLVISQDKGESPSLQGLTLEVFGIWGVPRDGTLRFKNFIKI
jgi:hypothetical protein